MKHLNYLIAILGMAALSPAFADVHVSINVGAPDFFGRVDIAGAPPPLLLRTKPILIEPPAVRVDIEPLYLRVRPEESRNWRRYCHRYDACGRPVYFVKDRWYHEVYVPHYRDHHEEFERREQERMEREREEHDRWRENEERERQRQRQREHEEHEERERRDFDHDRHDDHDEHHEHHDNGRRRHGHDHDDHNDHDDRD